MRFHDFKDFKLPEDFVITNSIKTSTIVAGAAEFSRPNMMNPARVPWIGATISPCGAPETMELVEHPSEAIKYYKEHGVDKLCAEVKMMGSRAILVFNGVDLDVYSRGLRKIKLTDTEHFELKVDCFEFCKSNNIRGFVADTEMLPWSRLGAELINREFIIPAVAYLKSSKNPDAPILFEKYRRTLNTYIKNDCLAFHVFDIVAFQERVSGEWMISNNRVQSIDWQFSGSMYPFKYLKNIFFREFVDLNDEIAVSRIISVWEEITQDCLLEGMVFKPMDRQLTSNCPIVLPAMKVRGKEYLRIIYGIEYERYIEKLRNRNLKWKRMQSIGEYILAREILYHWIAEQNGEPASQNRENYVFAYMGLRKSNKALAIDATL